MEDVSTVFVFHEILAEAVQCNCTDVHVFPSEDGDVVVQFRTGGRLVPYRKLDAAGFGLIRRIKAMARMDVGDSRIPQDGSFEWESETLGVHCDIRVATLPTIRGEAIVMRLFPVHHSALSLATLGMSETLCRQLTELLQIQAGMILVAGQTGTGKTTTLYTMMLLLAGWGKRVVSIEDPVEMALAGCHQVEVRERSGVTFDVALRAMLRLDPDVIMVGEIRDEATAKVALRAALTGHLVLSTTHAGDLVGAAARIVDLGGSRSVVGDTLRGVVIQGRHANPSGRFDFRFDLQVMTAEFARVLSSDLTWQEVRNQWQRTPGYSARTRC